MEQSNSHKLRLSLASAIRHHIQEAGMTGKQASAYSGVAGSRISAIMLGKVGGISCDALVDVLGKFGYSVEEERFGNSYSFHIVGEQVKQQSDLSSDEFFSSLAHDTFRLVNFGGRSFMVPRDLSNGVDEFVEGPVP